MNHLKVVTTTSDEYAASFGFTEEEVFSALENYGFAEEKEKVKFWYDGFIFGKYRDIYNPWSILNFLDTGKYNAYWANTSANSLVGKLILEGNLKAMNAYMSRVVLQTFSYFDTGKGPLGAEPERFYHGFVLGLSVELSGRYVITSNRESGFGRYDIMLEPKNKEDNAYILEFKIYDKEDEEGLKDTVQAALAQIEEKPYEASLIARGITAERIRKYGFAFEGKKVLIG